MTPKWSPKLLLLDFCHHTCVLWRVGGLRQRGIAIALSFFFLYVVPIFIHFLYFFSFKLKIGLNTVLRVQPIVFGHLNIRKSDAVVGVDSLLS